MSDLRVLAAKATPGPWITSGPTSDGWRHPVRGDGSVTYVVARPTLRVDSEYISAWSPERAVAALDVIELAQKREAAEEALADSEHRIHDGSAREREHLESDRAVAIHDLRAAIARWEAL